MSLSSTPLRLARWYAGFNTSRAREGPDVTLEASAVRRLGPLTIYNPTDGCDVATFGDAVDPSVALADGYVFDRADLAAELGVMRACSTAEIIAAAYDRWGTGVFQRLDGCYLIAIWDARARRLLVGRDGMGRNPVFYSIVGDTLWFTSNILALSASGRVSNAPNRLSLALAMVTHWPSVGETFFEQIHRLRPLHYLVATTGSDAVERKYWDIIPDGEDAWLSEREVLDGFEPALVRAVERCMALTPHGIMLSGGVDSVTIAALASEYGRAHALPPLVAMSGRTGDAIAPDEQMQSDVAKALGLPHIITTTPEWTNGRDRIDLALEMAKDLPAPSRVYWVGTYSAFYRCAVAHGLTTVLSGAGGDNWLGVADVHAADLMSRFKLFQVLKFIKASTGTGGRSLSKALRRLLWTSGLRPHVDTRWAQIAPGHKKRYHLRKWRERLPPWVCPDDRLKEQLVENLVGRRTPPLTDEGRVPKNYYLHSLRMTTNSYMHYEYETAHHVEHLTGLRVLSPYHDRALVTFFNRISPRVLLHGTRYKGLLRPVVAKRLPSLGLENQRKEYPREAQNATLEAVRASIARAWPGERFESLGFEVLGRLGVVDAPLARREIDHVRSYGYEEVGGLFALLHADRWVRIHAGM